MDRHAAMVMRVLLLWLVALWPCQTWADGTVTGTTQQVRMYYNQEAPSAYVYTDAGTACQAFTEAFVRQVASWNNTTNFVDVHYYSTNNPTSNSGTCTWRSTYTPNGGTASVNLSWGSALVSQTVCPSHATGGGQSTTCTCEAGYIPDAAGTACVANCTAGEVLQSGYFDIGTDKTKAPRMVACVGVCETYFDGVSPAGSTLVNGVEHWYALGLYAASGNECQAGVSSGTGATDIPAPSCGTGQVLGTLNDKPVCGDAGPGEPAVPSKTETETTTKTAPVDNGDGTTTETSTTTKTGTNPDGTTGTQTTTTTTTCDQAGNCETTTETETTGSYVDPEDAGQEDQPSECELHPNTAGCAELDTPTGPDLPTSNVSIAGVSPQSGWGADDATCPALVHTVSLGDVDVFGLICTYMQGIRFLVIGISWLIAALIFIGRTD